MVGERWTTRWNHDTLDGRWGSLERVPMAGWESRYKNCDTELTDMVGREIKDGDWLCRARVANHTAIIEVRYVREIKDGKIYLDESRVPLQYPGRTLIVNHEVSEIVQL